MKESVYRGLSEILAGTGFKLVKSVEGFTRRSRTGSHTLTVPLWEYPPTFTFSLVVGVRLDAVEDIFNESSGLPPKNQQRSRTVMTALTFFTGPARREYAIRELADVDAALQELRPVLETDVLPFLERYSDLSAVDRALHIERLPGFDITESLFAMRHSLIVARLAGNPRYLELLRQYRDIMAAAPPVEQERFDRLVERLDGL